MRKMEDFWGAGPPGRTSSGFTGTGRPGRPTKGPHPNPDLVQAMLGRYRELENSGALRGGVIPSAPLKVLCDALGYEFKEDEDVEAFMRRAQRGFNRVPWEGKTIHLRLVRHKDGKLEIGFWPVKARSN
jgi:hypothetical protein